MAERYPNTEVELMASRFFVGLVILGLLLAWWVGRAVYAATFVVAQDATISVRSVVVPGDTVIISWDCFPVSAGPPCFTERIHITSVERDGWWTVRDEVDGRPSRTWRINPARAVGYTLDNGPEKVAAR